MINSASVNSARQRAILQPGKRIELNEGDGRGGGRLKLHIVASATGSISEIWYVVYYDAGVRKMTKIGALRDLPIAEARRIYRSKFRGELLEGRKPETRKRAAAPGATISDLFEAYLANLEAEQKDTKGPRHYLLGSKKASKSRWRGRRAKSAADWFGPSKGASEITEEDVRDYLASIHARGSVSAASHARSYLRGAFNYAIKSKNAYHRPAGAVDWGLKTNPVANIPADPAAKRAGNRFLSAPEVRVFWRWLEARKSKSAAAPVLLLCIATGQRAGELLRLTNSAAAVNSYRRPTNGGEGELGLWDAAEKTIYWQRTKNKLPHLAPVCELAAQIIDQHPITPDGLYFPKRKKPLEPMTINALEQLVGQFLQDHPNVARFTPRDLRRTWKTLAGAAGLSKEIRDHLQNHTEQDVSSRHYDRYTYLREKKAAVAQWGEYLDAILAESLEP